MLTDALASLALSGIETTDVRWMMFMEKLSTTTTVLNAQNSIVVQVDTVGFNSHEYLNPASLLRKLFPGSGDVSLKLELMAFGVVVTRATSAATDFAVLSTWVNLDHSLAPPTNAMKHFPLNVVHRADVLFGGFF